MRRAAPYANATGALEVLEVVRRADVPHVVVASSHEVGIETLPPRPGDVPNSQADSSRLLALFPDVQPVGLEEGLRATVAWFRQSS